MQDVIRELDATAFRTAAAGELEKAVVYTEAASILRTHEEKAAIARRRAENKAARKARRANRKRAK